MIIATRKNMRDYDQYGLLMLDRTEGSEYSADAGDYFMKDEDEEFLDSEGEPMILLVKMTLLTDPKLPEGD